MAMRSRARTESRAHDADARQDSQRSGAHRVGPSAAEVALVVRARPRVAEFARVLDTGAVHVHHDRAVVAADDVARLPAQLAHGRVLVRARDRLLLAARRALGPSFKL
eukprot:4343168-Pleurochrysis_carterae.AAC.1